MNFGVQSRVFLSGRLFWYREIDAMGSAVFWVGGGKVPGYAISRVTALDDLEGR